MKYLLICLFISFQASAALVSSNLSESDRDKVLRTLGNSSSLKILGDPYPLGGYSGFELGLSIETVSTDSFVDLGDGSAGGKLLTYPVVSIGKGLYENLDLFVNFSLFGTENRVGTYGGILRWGFFESKTIPLTLSLSLQSLSNNFDNQITGELYGGMINVGLNFNNSSYYLGLGKVNAQAEFAKEIVDSPNQEKAESSDTHFKVGAVWHFSPYFVSLELNRYYISHFTGKIGLRF